MRLKNFSDILDHHYEGIVFVDCNNQVVYWNESAARITGYSPAETRGQNYGDERLNHLDITGLPLETCPLKQTLADGQPRAAKVFLRHKAGHRFSVKTHTHPLLDKNGKIIGAVEIFQHHALPCAFGEDLENAQAALPGKRSRAEQTIAGRLAELRGTKRNFGVLLIRLISYKALRAAYGEDCAANALKVAAETLANSLRQTDCLTHWGGEHFLVITSEIEPAEFDEIALRLSRLLAQSTVPAAEHFVELEAVIGTCLALAADEPADLIRRCEQLLENTDPNPE